MERDPGFYWIVMAGLPPEVAYWNAEAREWLITGAAETVPEGHPADIRVIEGPLKITDGKG